MSKTITRRAAIAGLSALGLAPAFAQSGGTITIAHGFTPGGNVDLTARLIAERLAAKLGQQVIVEPKPGAGGSTAAAQVARATPDGTTLFLAAGGHAVSAAIYNKLPYDALKDFSWISMLSDFPFVFVTYPDHPAKNLGEFIAMAKADAGKLLCATPGNGTGQHLALELFAATAGINPDPKICSVGTLQAPSLAESSPGRRRSGERRARTALPRRGNRLAMYVTARTRESAPTRLSTRPAFQAMAKRPTAVRRNSTSSADSPSAHSTARPRRRGGRSSATTPATRIRRVRDHGIPKTDRLGLDRYPGASRTAARNGRESQEVVKDDAADSAGDEHRRRHERVGDVAGERRSCLAHLSSGLRHGSSNFGLATGWARRAERRARARTTRPSS